MPSDDPGSSRGAVRRRDGASDGRRDPFGGVVSAVRRRRAAGRRARKVHRVVRHVDLWSVFRVALAFSVSAFLALCVASVLLWGAARASGTVERVEDFVTSLGGFGTCEPIEGAGDGDGAAGEAGDGETAEPATPDEGGADADDGDCSPGTELVGGFEFEDSALIQSFVLGGLVLVLAGTALAVVAAALFNLICELTGGLRVTVLEEEPAPVGRAGRRAGDRAPPAAPAGSPPPPGSR